jgi:protein tyrosine phosphatase
MDCPIISKILTLKNGGSLFVSGVKPYLDLEIFQKNEIGLILAIIPDQLRNINIQRYIFPIYDDPSVDISSLFDTTFSIIYNALCKGTNVLVHCRSGVSRSVSIIIAFMIRFILSSRCKCSIPINTSKTLTYSILSFIRLIRPCVNPNPGFMKQLYTYELRLRTGN